MIKYLMLVTPLGEKKFVQIRANSLDEVSQTIPQGVYTTFRTYQKTKALDLDSHFDRLETSAAILGKEITIERNQIRQTIRDYIDRSPESEMRIRISVNLASINPEIYIFGEPLVLLVPDIYKRGTNVCLLQNIKREKPLAKSTSFILNASDQRKHLPEGVNEGLMVGSNGEILEGLSSNFFAIIDQKLWTASIGILEGITRNIALRCAVLLDIKSVMQGVNVRDLNSCEEAFITSASRGILPVVKIDEVIIGKGQPGPKTRSISQKFDEIIQEEIQEI